MPRGSWCLRDPKAPGKGRPEPSARPRPHLPPPAPSSGIVLAMGAGAARGAALAGVLRRLRAAAIPIDAIVGCSVGAIVAALYAAAGVEPEEMIESARRLRPASLFNL